MKNGKIKKIHEEQEKQKKKKEIKDQEKNVGMLEMNKKKLHNCVKELKIMKNYYLI